MHEFRQSAHSHAQLSHPIRAHIRILFIRTTAALPMSTQEGDARARTIFGEREEYGCNVRDCCKDVFKLVRTPHCRQTRCTQERGAPRSGLRLEHQRRRATKQRQELLRITRLWLIITRAVQRLHFQQLAIWPRLFRRQSRI